MPVMEDDGVTVIGRAALPGSRVPLCSWGDVALRESFGG
jgi:hypothetical protein